jgi:hypothetical protein
VSLLYVQAQNAAQILHIMFMFHSIEVSAPSSFGETVAVFGEKTATQIWYYVVLEYPRIENVSFITVKHCNRYLFWINIYRLSGEDGCARSHAKEGCHGIGRL